MVNASIYQSCCMYSTQMKKANLVSAHLSRVRSSLQLLEGLKCLKLDFDFQATKYVQYFLEGIARKL